MRTLATLVSLLLLIAGGGPSLAAGAEEALERALHRAVVARAALPDGARVRLAEVRAGDPGLVTRARGVRSVTLPAGERGTGVVTARVRLDMAGRADAETWVRARVEAEAPAVVLTRDVARGEALEAGALEVAARPVRAGAVTSVDAALGRVARRSLRAGETLLDRWTEAPELVERGARVEAIVQAGALTVRARGEALEGGASGERVRVRIDGSGRVLRGRVVGPGVVEVTP